MAAEDLKFVREYLDPEDIAVEWPLSELDPEDLAVAVEAIYLRRRAEVLPEVRAELRNRERWQEELLAALDDEGVVVFNLFDILPERREYGWDFDVMQELDKQGKFVGFSDFQQVRRDQVQTSEEYLATLFHILVLFFVQDSPDDYQKALRRLREDPPRGMYGGGTLHKQYYFIRGEALIPYAAEKVEPRFKIPGVGRKGRRIMRAVLYDDEDVVEEQLAIERTGLN